MRKTGFKAFWFYNTVTKMHFGKGKYNVMEQKLPRREVFVKSWNDKYRNRSGHLFQKIEKYLPEKRYSYIKLFAFYWIKKSNYYVTDIFSDDFKLYKTYEYELNNLEEVVEKDFINILNFCQSKGLKLKQFFFSKRGFPPVLKIYEKEKISVHSLIAFNIAFNIHNRIDTKTLDIIEEEKFKKIEQIWVDYYKIVLPYFSKIDWKQFFKTLI
jgi:hypothetical protein